MTISQDLLDILCCPKCKGDLALTVSASREEGLACSSCGLLYPIRDGIPVMLIEEALPYKSDDQK